MNHDIILHKLKFKFNVDGVMLKFLIEYLKGRKQKVVVDQAMSTKACVLSGVPQGSILGPLLFVLFINDMHSVVSPGTSIALYADDTKIWRNIDSDEDSVTLNKDIAALEQWALPFYNFPYCLSGVFLDFCESEKDLGLHITRTA